MSTPAKRGMRLDRVVLLGRTFEEYCRYFLIEPEQWRDKRILDVASGVSSFGAEARAHGLNVTSFDPIYSWPAAKIEERTGPDVESVFKAIEGLRTYKWDYYRNPEQMKILRKRASSTFLEDYKRHPEHYISGLLPDLPFPANTFDLVLVSYLLFAYEEQFSYEFHRDSILSLMRVTRGEARIYPLVTFEAERSSYLDRLIADPALRHLALHEVKTDFEFLLNSNWYLRITRR